MIKGLRDDQEEYRKSLDPVERARFDAAEFAFDQQNVSGIISRSMEDMDNFERWYMQMVCTTAAQLIKGEDKDNSEAIKNALEILMDANKDIDPMAQ